VKVARVTAAIVVLNLQSVPTTWYAQLHQLDVAFAIARRRINFIGPPSKSGNGTKYGASKNGTMFVYYGPDKMRFWRAFDPIAYPFEDPLRT
jgi:hypothetical protein